MANRVCPTCGVELPGDAPEALCPRCLMQAGFDSPTFSGRRGFTPPSVAELSPHFPQLQVLGLIGQGGMGAVYKARQLKLDRLVALKVLPNSSDSDPAFAERFSREARALARMQHPHIVSVHDFGEAGGHYYLLLEYVDGMNLRELMRTGLVPQEQAIRVMQALADALQYAHQSEIIHRDIKPENVLIDRQGRVKIADFGLAKLAGLDPAGFTLTGASEAMGTPHYMAPEQLERPKEVDHRADLYSLGVLSYELLTGELPMGRFDPPSAKSGGDPRLDEIVMKCLERDPAKRFQSAAEIQAALEAIEKQPAPSYRAESVSPAAAPPAPLPAQPDMIYEPIALVGLLALSIGIVIGIAMTKSAWFAFGLLGVEQLAATINWRPQLRAVIGTLLIMAGIGTALVILAYAYDMWWMILLIWFWYGERAYRYFKRAGAGSSLGLSALWGRPSADDSSPRHWLLQAIAPFESSFMVTVTHAADIDGETLENIRRRSNLPAAEEVLATVQLTDDEERDLLVIGTEGLYFPAKHDGTKILGSIPYSAISNRKFVNHGRGVYVGDDTVMIVDPNMWSCEALARLLDAIRDAVVRHQAERESATKP